jgi:hypothetical protein
MEIKPESMLHRHLFWHYCRLNAHDPNKRTSLMAEKLVCIEKKQLKYRALEVESEIELGSSSRDTCHEESSSIVANSACYMSILGKLCGFYLSWVVVVAEKRDGGASEHASGCLMGIEGE